MLKTIAQGIKLSPFALLLNPAFWLAICLWTALVAYYCRDVGAEQERLKQVQMTADALDEQSKANDKVLAAERKLRADDSKEFTTFKEEQENAKTTTNKLISDLQRDVRRLRVPVRRPVCPGPSDGSGAPAAGAGEEGYAELTADGSEFLVGLLARGDEGIRKHATVVDLYESLRLACTAPHTH